LSGIQQSKQAIRERVWASLERAEVVEPGVRGHIPDFAGSDKAAMTLASIDRWRDARVVKSAPDRAQYPVRVRALQAGKLLYMAVPRLAEIRPFYRLDPGELDVAPEEAADKEFAARIAPTVGIGAMKPVDLVVCGSVAVNEHGARLGKGAGYSDIEMALLTAGGLLGEKTMIATTVHELQLLHEDLPEEEHDFRVDLIATPERVIWCQPARRPAGLDWTSLTSDQIAAMPALQQEIRSRSQK
jgi:5-formyltetrahydrofolate cyclo-ligase